MDEELKTKAYKSAMLTLKAELVSVYKLLKDLLSEDDYNRVAKESSVKDIRTG